MNPRENFMTAIAHKKPEWVPIYSRPVRWNVGLLDPFEKGPAGGGKDGFGVDWIWDNVGPVPSTARLQVTDITKWREQTQFPDLDAIDWETKAAKELAGADRNNCIVEYSMGNGPYERLLALMGIEEVSCAFYEEPEAVAEFLDAWAEYKIRHIELVAKYYRPDFISIFDDVAYESGLFVTREIYRDLISPIHKRCNDAIRAHGILPIRHCCGKAEYLVEDFIAEGAVAWSSVQPVNDIEAILQKYGDRLTIIGGFDSNGKAARLTATEEERRAEVRRAIDTYAPYGSYMICNLLVSGPTPEETRIRTGQLLDEAIRYGGSFYKKAASN